MKKSLLFIFGLSLMASLTYGQVMFTDYETVSLDKFGGFGGATFEVIANPTVAGINTSANVGHVTTGAETWDGIYSTNLGGKIDLRTNSSMTVKVLSANAGVVAVKLEVADTNTVNVEVTADYTDAGNWQELTFDFSAALPFRYTQIVLFFDFGVADAGEEWYFDDVQGVDFVKGTGETVTFTVSDYVGLTSPLVRVYDNADSPTDYTLFDDGTNGDPVSGDLAWTAVAADLVGSAFNTAAGVGSYSWEVVAEGSAVSDKMNFSLAAGEIKATSFAHYSGVINNDLITILPIPTAPVIDGTIDAVWDNYDAIPFTRTSTGSFDNPADLSVSVKTAFGRDTIYFLGMISDDVLSVNNTNVYERDCFELYFDMNNNDTYEGGDGQKRWVWSEENADSPGRYAQVDVDGGWVIEIAIAFTDLSTDFVLAEDVTIGFDMGSGDNDSDAREGIATWHMVEDAGWNTPSVLGEMKFVNVSTVKKERGATTVWNPAANPGSDGSWTDYKNWTDWNVPYLNKVVFNVPGALESAISSEVDTIKQLVMGDNGDGGTLVVKDGGVLTTSAGWSAVGYSDTATLIVETGGVVNFAEHMWLGLAAGGDGVVILDGGTINVTAMTGLGWDQGDRGTVLLNSGMLNLGNLGDASIKDGSIISIKDGTLYIKGDKSGLVNDFITAGKIAAENADLNLMVSFDAVADKTMVIARKERKSTTVWNPAANAASDGSWTDRKNWTDERVPYLNKVVFNVADALESVISSEVDTIKQLVMGDNGDGGTLRVADGGVLVTSAGWSAVGYSDTATLVVETGGEVSFAEHMWLGLAEGGDGVVILEGGTVNVAAMTGLGWDQGDRGTIHVNSGLLNLGNLGDASIKDGSIITIKDGTLQIKGDKTGLVNDFITAGKIAPENESLILMVSFDSDADKTMVVAVKERKSTTVWNPAANAASDGSWTDNMNWTDENVPYMNKVVFNVADAMESVISSEVDTIKQLVMGDNGDGGTLRVADGGVLVTSAGWSAVGYSDTATLVVETGGEVSFAEHMWLGLAEGGDGVVILNGGTVNVAAMTGLGWDKGDRGTIHVNSGLLNLGNLGDASIKDGSVIDIEEGTININGDKLGLINDFVAAGKITGYAGTGFVYASVVDDVTIIFASQEAIASDDASLRALSTDVGTLTPAFDAAVLAYTVEVPEGTTSVTVTATATSAAATIVGDGAVDVSSGSGSASIVVTAEDGTSTETYTVDISVLVSARDNVTSQIGFYPNPASDNIYLKDNTVADIYVYSTTGVLVLDDQNVSSLSIRDLSSGNYFVKVIFNDKVSVGSLIIE